jgi:hypothetical protein
VPPTAGPVAAQYSVYPPPAIRLSVIVTSLIGACSC